MSSSSEKSRQSVQEKSEAVTVPVDVKLPLFARVSLVVNPASPPGEVWKTKSPPFKTSKVGVAERVTKEAETEASPATSRVAVGVVVPIPTLPVPFGLIKTLPV